MRHPDLPLYFAVMSHGRSDAVEKVHAYMGSEATWYVGEGEKSDYRKAGAKRVVEGGSLCASRNIALDDAWQQGVTCVQVSDDLRRLSLATTRLEPISATTA